MKKIFLTILLLIIPFINPTNAKAAEQFCTPSVKIDDNNNYNTILTFSNGYWDKQTDGTRTEIFITQNNLSATTTVSNKQAVFNLGKMIPGSYTLSLFIGNSSVCNPKDIGANFIVPDHEQGGNITTKTGNIEFLPVQPLPNDIITITAKDLPDDAIYFTSVTQYTDPKNSYKCIVSQNKQLSFSVGPLIEGSWDVYITKNQDQQNINNCHSGSTDKFFASATIAISAQGVTIQPTPTPPPAPCPNNSCPTAIGDISTKPTEFVGRIFGILLSLAGGVALILIMISGYRLMVSQGNPEKVKEAQEQLTSAIVGLLFVIFSITILQIIGVDILHIPGFQ